MKGKRTNSTACRTKIGAESELFEFRFSKESKEGKKKILERIQELKRKNATVPLQIDVANVANNNTTSSSSNTNSTENNHDDSDESYRKGVFSMMKSWFLERQRKVRDEACPCSVSLLMIHPLILEPLTRQARLVQNSMQKKLTK